MPKSGFSHIRRSYWFIAILGAILVVSSVTGMISDSPLWAAFLMPLGLGVLFLLFARWGLRIGAVMPVLSSSYNLVQSGRLVEAEALLDSIAKHKARNIVSSVRYQRALIAARRGDLAQAGKELDIMLALRPPWLSGATGVMQRASGHGLRAWARAATGDLEGAQSDIESARAAETPGSAALAHASLAEALMLERKGERAALTAVLRRDESLLLHSLDMRERSVVRAMKRMLRAPATSVYRTAIDPKKLDVKDEPPIAEWVDRVTPELAPFLPRPRAQKSADAPVFEPSVEAAKDAQKTHNKRGRSVVPRVVGLWVLLIMMYAAIREFLAPVTPPHGRRTNIKPVPPMFTDANLVTALGALITVVFVAAIARIVLVVRRARRNTRRIYELEPSLARGEDVTKELEEMARSRQETAASQAEALLASAADRRGDIEGALRHTEAARGKLKSSAARNAAAGILGPMITGQRAYALAALGRTDEAAAELTHLPPDYLFLARTRFVVPLVAMLAKGDIEGAGRLVSATSPDLGVGPRDELMRDLVHAVTSPQETGAAEIARLRDELRDRTEHRTWIQKYAPTLITRFEQAVAGPGEQALTSEGEAEIEAEREALAEAEAHRELKPEKRSEH